MITPEIIPVDDWVERFRPLVNPVDATCGYDFGDGCTLVETYADHLTYLATIPEERIWTVVENDGTFTIVSGRALVNRIGHVVTEVPWTNDVEVPLEEDD